MGLSRCPNCGHKGKAGLTHCYFFVYTCGQCGHRYCYQCPDSNGGRKCPRCGDTSQSWKEKVYEE